MKRLFEKWPVFVVWLRLSLPLCTGITYTVSALFYNIDALQTGGRLKVSAARLLFNTFAACRRYLAGEHTAPQSRYYGLLTAGAALSVLCWLAAAFFSVAMLVCAWRIFRATKKGIEAKRAKTVFKIAFPNRVWLFCSSCLWLVPALYAHWVAWIGQLTALPTVEAPLYLTFDLPLTLVVTLTALTAVLALLAPRCARRMGHDLFLA